MEEECSICLDQLIDKEISSLDCGHKFHLECIQDWLTYDLSNHTKTNKLINKCPICSQGKQIIAVYKIKSINSNDSNKKRQLLKVYKVKKKSYRHIQFKVCKKCCSIC